MASISMNDLQHDDLFESQPLLDSDSTVTLTNPTSSGPSVWRKSLSPLGAYCCCQVAFQGIFTSLVLYLKRVRQEDNASAAATVTAVLGTGFCTSFFAAFISDGYLGRLWSSVLILTVLLLGCTFLSIITQLQIQSTAFFTISLYVAGLGYGWFKPGLAALGGDQFELPRERNTFYNLLFVAGTVGEIFSLTVVIYLEDAGLWALGYWICTAAVAMGVVCLLGMRGVRYSPRENPFKVMAQVIVAALRKYGVKAGSDSETLFEPDIDGILHTDSLRFLDKAATICENELESGGASQWRLCSVSRVEEVKSVVRILPMWATLLCKAAATSQLTTLFVEQGDAMDAQVGSFQIAPASMTLFNMVARLLIAIAMELSRRRRRRRRHEAFSATETDSFASPRSVRHNTFPTTEVDSLRLLSSGIARRVSHPVVARPSRALFQIALAFVAAMFAMLSAAAVEAARLAAARTSTTLSILWLVPQYALEGVALVAGVVGEADFFYAGARPGVRSLLSSLPVLSRGLGSYISSFLVTLVTAITSAGGRAGWIASNLNEGHLDYYFLLLACIMVIDFLIFLALARSYSCPLEQDDESKAT